MLRKHSASRPHSKAAGDNSHRGSHSSGEISHISREISHDPVVLIVDRDNLLRWAIYETLTDAGFRVLAAPSSICAEGWIHQIEQNLSLALIDDDAWPLTPSVRTGLRTRWPTLPIVVMLHDEDQALETRTRAHGATDVIVKPFDLPDLVKLIERLTGSPHVKSETRVAPAV